MENQIKCQYCKEYFSKYGIKNHIKLAHTEEGQLYLKTRKDPFGNSRAHNKGKTISNEQKKKLSEALSGNKNAMYGKKLNNSIKQQISNGMKKAHFEGRANNWQDSKKYYNSSYPETFFERVIQNEFEDKNYIREYRMGKYAIDFAWIDKKLAIEIDGQQHEKQKDKDLLKDEYLKSQGWKVLRIKWLDIFNNTKQYIKLAKEFID